MGASTRMTDNVSSSQSLSLSWIVEATDLVFISPRNSNSDDLVALRAPTLTVSVVMRETSWSAPTGTLVSEQGDALYFDPDTNKWTFEGMMGESSTTTGSDESNAGNVGGGAGLVEEMQSMAQSVFRAIERDVRRSAEDKYQQERPPSLSPYNPVVPPGSSSSAHLGNDRTGVSVSATQGHRRSLSLGETHSATADDTNDGSVDEYYDTFDASPMPLGNPNSPSLPYS